MLCLVLYATTLDCQLSSKLTIQWHIHSVSKKFHSLAVNDSQLQQKVLQFFLSLIFSLHHHKNHFSHSKYIYMQPWEGIDNMLYCYTNNSPYGNSPIWGAA
jgi:hypothetical protein